MTSLTVDEYSAAPERKARRVQEAAAAARHLRVLEQAAVTAQDLTGHPAWDKYLSYLQAAVEVTQRQQADLQARLADPKIVGHDALMQIKLALQECDGRLAAWRSAMTLPREIMENGDKAKGLLEKMPEIDAP